MEGGIFMVNKEQLDDFCQTILAYHPSACFSVDKLNENFDFKIFELVNYLNDKNYELTDKEWSDLYWPNKDQPLLAFQIVKSGKAPIDIVENILLNLPLNKRENLHFAHVEQSILLESFKYSVSEEVIDELFKDGDEFPYPSLYGTYSTIEAIKSLPSLIFLMFM